MLGKFDINPATGKQYGINPATGVQDDTYWAEVVEPQLKAQRGFDPAEAFKQVEDTFKRRQDERNRIMTEFKNKNPFAYDEVLAKKMVLAREQLEPYYNQTLRDYLQGVDTQRTRTVEDRNTLLTELSRDVGTYTDREQTNLQLALESAREGKARAGLLESGAARRAEGLTGLESGQRLQDFLTESGMKKQRYETAGTRDLADLQRKEFLGQRDILREKEYETRFLAGTQAKEEGTKYGYALRQALGHLADENTQGDVLRGLGI